MMHFSLNVQPEIQILKVNYDFTDVSNNTEGTWKTLNKVT